MELNEKFNLTEQFSSLIELYEQLLILNPTDDQDDYKSVSNEIITKIKAIKKYLNKANKIKQQNEFKSKFTKKAKENLSNITSHFKINLNLFTKETNNKTTNGDKNNNVFNKLIELINEIYNTEDTNEQYKCLLELKNINDNLDENDKKLFIEINKKIEIENHRKEVFVNDVLPIIATLCAAISKGIAESQLNNTHNEDNFYNSSNDYDINNNYYFDDDSIFTDSSITNSEVEQNTSENTRKVIYNTKEWKGYGKQNYYYNQYEQDDENIYKFKVNRYKHFDGKENEWVNKKKLETTWKKDSENIPDWLKKYLEK